MAIGQMKHVQVKKLQDGQRICTTDNGEFINFVVTGHGVANA